MPAFWAKLGANDLNCVDVPLNPTHSWPCHHEALRCVFMSSVEQFIFSCLQKAVTVDTNANGDGM